MPVNWLINFEFNLIILHFGAASLTSALCQGVNSPHGRLRCQTLSAHGSQHTHPGRHGLAPAYTQTHASTCTLTSVREHHVDAQTAGTIQSRCHTPGVFFPPCQHTACELCHHSVDMLVTSSLPPSHLSVITAQPLARVRLHCKTWSHEIRRRCITSHNKPHILLSKYALCSCVM